MLAQEANASDDGTAQAQNFCDITIVDLNNREIPIKVSASLQICLYPYRFIKSVSWLRTPPLSDALSITVGSSHYFY